MPRPVSIRNEAVLEAARRVFLQHGYGVSTALVAREAGISEGSIFKHFKTKADLFRAAMEPENGEPPWQQQLAESVGKGDIRKSLEQAGRQILERMRTLMPCIVMVRARGITLQGPCHRAEETPAPLQHAQTLAGYFRAEMRQGRLDMKSPEIQAHAFFGALCHYAFCETLFGHPPASPAAYVRTVVDNVMQASVADRGPVAAKRNPSRAKGRAVKEIPQP